MQNNIFFYLGLSVVIFHVVFILGQLKKNNGIVDPFWSISFMILAAASFGFGNRFIASSLLTVLVFVWGLRLASHLTKRFLKMQEEDWRYQEFRTKWGKHPMLGAYIQVYLLQGFLAWLVMLPVLSLNIGAFEVTNYVFMIPGFLVWCFGLWYEATGDKQLKTFLANPKNKGKLMTLGLWSKTRHPNYFGEAVLWWGIWLMVVAASPKLYWTVVGPLTITLLIRYVSGVTMTERKQSKHPEWPAYAAKTPPFIPKF